MLSVTGLNHFYYVRDFTYMRCKHSVYCLSSVNGFTGNRVMEMSLLSCLEIEE